MFAKSETCVFFLGIVGTSIQGHGLFQFNNCLVMHSVLKTKIQQFEHFKDAHDNFFLLFWDLMSNLKGVKLRIQLTVKGAKKTTWVRCPLPLNFLIQREIPFQLFLMGRVPSGVNVEGAEVHGLSMGKKSSPKIDGDLREGKYLCTFTYRRERKRWELASCYLN